MHGSLKRKQAKALTSNHRDPSDHTVFVQARNKYNNLDPHGTRLA